MRIVTHRLNLLVASATLFFGFSYQAAAAPIIYEVFYDAASSDSGLVFTELFGEAGTTLDGWSLVGVNGGTGVPYRTLDLTGAMFPSDGLLVIAQDSATGALALERDFVANIDWQNGPDAVQLLDPMSTLIDALQYGDAGVGNAGLGSPAADAAAGFSLSRDGSGTNTGNNFVDFSVTTPTPGLGPTGPPPTPVPEPSTVVLLGIGMGASVIRRWRMKWSQLNAVWELVAQGDVIMIKR